MTDTVEVTVETWQRFEDMDDWLKNSAKGPVHVFIPLGSTRRTPAGAYNVAGQVGIVDNPVPLPIGLDTKLRFVFDTKSEAVYFKTKWG